MHSYFRRVTVFRGSGKIFVGFGKKIGSDFEKKWGVYRVVAVVAVVVAPLWEWSPWWSCATSRF